MSTEIINSSMNIAVVGIGNYGKKRIASFSKYSTKIANLYLVDLDFKGLTKDDVLLHQFKNVIFKKSVDNEVLTNSDIIFLSIPNHQHYGLVNKICDLDIKVFVEKPLCINLKELEALNMKSKAFKANIRMGSNLRYFPSFMKMTDLIKGEDILEVCASIGHDGTVLKKWNKDHALSGGGTLLDNGIHCLSYLNNMFGELRFSCIDKVSQCLNNIEDDISLQVSSSRCPSISISSSWKRAVGYADIEVKTPQGIYRTDAFDNVVHYETYDGNSTKIDVDLCHRSIEYETKLALEDFNTERWSNFTTLMNIHSVIFKAYSTFEN